MTNGKNLSPNPGCPCTICILKLYTCSRSTTTIATVICRSTSSRSTLGDAPQHTFEEHPHEKANCLEQKDDSYQTSPNEKQHSAHLQGPNLTLRDTISMAKT